MSIPNRFPVFSHPAFKLAVIGDFPHQDDSSAVDANGNLDPQPFVSSYGKLLKSIIGQCKLASDQIFMGNVCQEPPHGNDPLDFEINRPEVQEGLKKLASDLAIFKPNCILALGRLPMYVSRPDLCYQGDRWFVVPLYNWRGSIVMSALGYKTVLCFHPRDILKIYADLPYFKFDVARAVEQSKEPDIQTTKRTGIYNPSIRQVVDYLRGLRLNHTSASLDIEGYPDNIGITCLSICPTPTTGISIPIHQGGRYWSEQDELTLWRELSLYLADPSCHKTCHNGFYEWFVFAWKHKLLFQGFNNDTMMMFWELYPELEKNLGVVNSICTVEPYYKDDRLSSNPQVKLEYNFKDSAITEEAKLKLESQLVRNPASYEHYRFNIAIAPAVTFLNLRGCKLDLDRLNTHKTKTEEFC